MVFLDIADRIIPGYKLLTEEEKAAFEVSLAGQILSRVVNEILLEVNNRPHSRFQQIFSSFNEASQEQCIRDAIEKRSDEINVLRSCDEYEALNGFIFLHHMGPDFSLLNLEQKWHLADSFSSLEIKENFLDTISELEQAERHFVSLGPLACEEDKERIKELTEHRNRLICDWHNNFLADKSFNLLRQTIQRNKGKTLIQQFAKVLPALSQQDLVNTFAVYYNAEMDGLHAVSEKAAETALMLILFEQFQQRIEQNLKFIDFKKFNQDKASELAEEIVYLSRRKIQLNLQAWFASYKQDLDTYIDTYIDEFLHQQPQMKWAKGSKTWLNSLSFLWRNPVAEGFKNFADKLAEAHMFIQYTGFGASSDSSIASILDAYATLSSAKQVSEYKAIMRGLLMPIFPLYEEYKTIALYEKNYFWKIFRILMPLIVFAAFVTIVSVAITLLLMPLVLPDAVFLTLLIPTVIAGLICAAQYVNFKNLIGKGYQWARQTYYGGYFEIPEYQVESARVRMEHIFGTLSLARTVRDLYIQEIKCCNEKEAEYRANPGSVEVKERQANLLYRHTLILEWYDIHSNTKLNFVNVRELIMERLHLIAEKEKELFQQNFEQNDKQIILSDVTVAKEELYRFLNSNPEENILLPAAAEEDVTVKKHIEIEESPLYSSVNPCRFFTCKPNKEKIEKLNALSNKIYSISPQCA